MHNSKGSISLCFHSLMASSILEKNTPTGSEHVVIRFTGGEIILA